MDEGQEKKADTEKKLMVHFLLKTGHAPIKYLVGYKSVKFTKCRLCNPQLFLLASPSKKPRFFKIGLLLGIFCGRSTLCELDAFEHSQNFGLRAAL